MSGELRVCGADVAPVRAEPDDASEQVTQVLRGEPLDGRGDARRLGARPHGVRLPRLDRVRDAGSAPGTGPGVAPEPPREATRSRRRAPTSARRTSGAG